MNDGGPAFPVQDLIKWQSPGMTLLDYFAGQALAGALANSGRDGTFEEYATDAYAFAEAMLAEREKVMARK